MPEVDDCPHVFEVLDEIVVWCCLCKRRWVRPLERQSPIWSFYPEQWASLVPAVYEVRRPPT